MADVKENVKDVSAENAKAKAEADAQAKAERDQAETARTTPPANNLSTRDPNAPTAEQRKEDRELTERRGDPSFRNPGHEDTERQHEAEQKRREERNDANREGHDKNMQRIEDEANEAQSRTEKGAYDHKPTGRQRDRNTPVINKDGSKSWVD